MREETSIERKKRVEHEMEIWLKTHENIPPRISIKRDGKLIQTKDMNEEEKREVSLAKSWKYYFEPKKIEIKGANGKIRILKKCDLNKIRKVVEWFRKNRGCFPKCYKENKEYLIYNTLKNPIFSEIIDLYEDMEDEKIPDVFREFIILYREIPRGEEDLKIIADWLDSHNGEMPRCSIAKNAKKLSRSEMSKEEHEEVIINNKWEISKGKKVLKKYEDTHLEEIPKRYRIYISRIREYGYGMSENLIFEEVIKWLNENQDRLPRTGIEHRGRELSQEEVFEINIRKRWNKLKITNVLKQYEGRNIEEVPEEYREKISLLREYGLGITSKDIENKIFEWLENHDGKLPREYIKENGVIIGRTKLSQEDYREIQLHKKWVDSEIRKVLLEYAGRPLEEVPKKFREKISILRSYGFGKEIIEIEDVFEELIKWLKSHNGKFPRTRIENAPRIKDMSDEERYEINLSHKWYNFEEREEILKYARMNIDIKNVPEEIREKVKILRENANNLESKEELREKRFEELIIWLKEHNGQLPKSEVIVNGVRILNKDLSSEKVYEKRLYKFWKTSKVRKILNEYFGRPLEEVPEEYREKIRMLREHNILGETPVKRMKKSVSRKVGENSSTRQELEKDIIIDKMQ